MQSNKRRFPNIFGAKIAVIHKPHLDAQSVTTNLQPKQQPNTQTSTPAKSEITNTTIPRPKKPKRH